MCIKSVVGKSRRDKNKGVKIDKHHTLSPFVNWSQTVRLLGLWSK